MTDALHSSTRIFGHDWRHCTKCFCWYGCQTQLHHTLCWPMEMRHRSVRKRSECLSFPKLGEQPSINRRLVREGCWKKGGEWQKDRPFMPATLATIIYSQHFCRLQFTLHTLHNKECSVNLRIWLDLSFVLTNFFAQILQNVLKCPRRARH